MGQKKTNDTHLLILSGTQMHLATLRAPRTQTSISPKPSDTTPSCRSPRAGPLFYLYFEFRLVAVLVEGVPCRLHSVSESCLGVPYLTRDVERADLTFMW